jgi:sec-independent protein translocase protein TatA
MVAAAGPFGLGPMELVIILLVLVLLFGATRLKDLGSSLGQGIKEFRSAVKEDEEEVPPAATATGAAAAANVAVAQNGSEVIAAVKCSSCGSLNDATAKHCNQCGTALVATVS